MTKHKATKNPKTAQNAKTAKNRRMLPYVLILSITLFLIAGCSQQAVISSKASGDDKPEVQAPEFKDGTYELDTQRSRLAYTAEKIVGNSHKGTVPISGGSIAIRDGMVSSGQFTIDMTGITEDKNNQMYLDHIRGPDFFDVTVYPTSTFTISRVTKTSDGYAVTGDLEIMGKTNEITFPADLSMNGDDKIVTAMFTIDRTRWDITYGSGSFFKELGDSAIKDDIGYDLYLVFP